MASASNVRAGGAFVELFTKDGKLVSGLNRAAARVKAFGATVSSMGSRLLVFGGLLAAPLIGAAKLFADMGSDMLDMSQRTGLAVEALSELRYAAEQSGSSAEELENALKFMQRGGFGRGADDLERIADELSRMTDPAMRTARAIEIFGRTGTRMLPMLIGGAEGVRQLRAEARRLGITMSTEDAQAAESFGDSLSTLLSVAKRAAFNIGGALAPALQGLASWLTKTSAGVGAWIRRNAGLVKIIGVAVAALTGLGLALILLGPAIGAVGVGIGIIAFAIKATIVLVGLLGATIVAMFSPLGMILLGLDLIRGALVSMALSGTNTIGALREGFRGVAQTARTAWQGISDSIAAGDWAGAARIALLGIRTAWAQMTSALRRSWDEFSGFFISIWDRAVAVVAQSIQGLRQSINMTANDWAALRQQIRGDDAQAREDQAPLEQRSRELADRIVAARRALAEERGISFEQAARIPDANIDEMIRQRNELQRVISGIGGTLITPDAGGINQSQLAAEAAAERRRQREAADARDLAQIAALQGQLQSAAGIAAILRAKAERPGKTMPGMPQTDLGALGARMEARGTFSAFAVAGLGAASVTDRIATATEETARNTRNNVAPVFTG